MTWDVLTVDQLDADSLVALREERLAAVRVAGFCDHEARERLTGLLARHSERTNYRVRWASRDQAGGGVLPGREFTETDSDRIGPVDTTPEGTADSTGVVAAMREIRSAAAPALAPIDRLRLELDEIAPRGAGLYRKDGRLSVAGVGRVMDTSGELVHADTGRRNCLTANVYLRMPRAGGGTRIWQYDGEYRQSRQSYLFGPGEIPQSMPSCLVEPAEGDLVVWNPALPHAVQPFDDPPRLTIQTWLLFEDGADAGDFAIRLLN
ncbi:MAG: 2OG-Fe(II) oxygenase [Streptosporangiaceae bacterium]|jgi:hypothetical protein